MARRLLGPATLAVARAVEQSLTDADLSLLVACSGGADSLALAAGARHVARRTERRAVAVVVDHRLQPGSAAAAARAAQQLSGLGYADVLRVEVEVDLAAGLGPEAAARRARYAALDAAAAQLGAVVLLGHTLDDQAETVLLGLARGSGPRSLAGMAARSGCHLRPLLGLRRATAVQACAELGLDPWRDPHNDDEAYARARVRARVLPVLETELGPGIAEALARTAALARADDDLLDRLAAEARAGVTSAGRTAGSDSELGEPGELGQPDEPEEPEEPGEPEEPDEPDELDCAALAGLPAALRSRVLRSWLIGGGAPEVSLAHVTAVADLVTDWHGQAGVDVPGLRVRRRGGRLVCGPGTRVAG